MNKVIWKKARICFSFLMMSMCPGISGITANATSESPPEKAILSALIIQPSDHVTDALWYQTMDRHIKSSARDLNMNVENFFAGDDRTKITSNVRAKIEAGFDADYLVFSNQVGIGVELLMLCEELNVKCFMIGSGLTGRDVETYGGPRQKLKNWIGQIIPDDEQAGYDLAIELIEQARKTKKTNNDITPIKVIGITGTSSTPASVNRTNGLHSAISSYEDVELLQIVSARWSGAVAASKYELLNERYGGIDVVWAASNDMALGVLEKARFLKKIPKIGGFDFVPPAIEALKESDLSAVMGGHEIDVAYVLKLLQAYHNGNDFVSETGTTSLHSRLISLTPETVRDYSTFLERLAKGEVNYNDGLDDLTEDKGALSNISMEGFKASVSHRENSR